MDDLKATKQKTKMPIAMIGTLCLLIATMIMLNLYLGKSNDISEFKAQVLAITKYGKSIQIMTDSRAGWALDVNLMNAGLFPERNGRVLNLSVNAGTPRAYLYIMEAINYESVKKGDVVIMFLTPEVLNRHNAFFNKTVKDFFTWENFFKELVLNGRYDNAKYFLANKGLPIMQLRPDDEEFFDLKKPEPSLTDMKAVAEMKKSTKERFRKEYLVRYNIDKYQVGIVKEISDSVKDKGGKFVLIMTPFPSDLRGVLDNEKLSLFTKAVHEIGKEKGVSVLDYVSGYTGNEFVFFDGSHFDNKSKVEFTKIIIKDIVEIIKE